MLFSYLVALTPNQKEKQKKHVNGGMMYYMIKDSFEVNIFLVVAASKNQSCFSACILNPRNALLSFVDPFYLF